VGGNLVGFVSTIADILTIVIQVQHPQPYKTNFSLLLCLFLSILPFFSSFVALLSRSVAAAMDSSMVAVAGAAVGVGADGFYRNGANVNF
jgi:hypothetical protein